MAGNDVIVRPRDPEMTSRSLSSLSALQCCVYRVKVPMK